MSGGFRHTKDMSNDYLLHTAGDYDEVPEDFAQDAWENAETDQDLDSWVSDNYADLVYDYKQYMAEIKAEYALEAMDDYYR